MIYDIPPYVFSTPTTVVVSGISGGGKTSWIKRVIANPSLFKDTPDRIVYCYGVWDDSFEDMKGVEFREGFDLPTDLGGYHTVLILDDLMTEIIGSSSGHHLFTRGSHHKNITVFFLIQNLYHQGKSARDIAVNAHYNVLMFNDKDLEQIRLIGRRQGMGNVVEMAYNDCMKTRYNYLLVDNSPHNPNRELKLKTNIFPGENQVVYLPLSQNI